MIYRFVESSTAIKSNNPVSEKNVAKFENILEKNNITSVKDYVSYIQKEAIKQKNKVDEMPTIQKLPEERKDFVSRVTGHVFNTLKSPINLATYGYFGYSKLSAATALNPAMSLGERAFTFLAGSCGTLISFAINSILGWANVLAQMFFKIDTSKFFLIIGIGIAACFLIRKLYNWFKNPSSAESVKESILNDVNEFSYEIQRLRLSEGMAKNYIVGKVKNLANDSYSKINELDTQMKQAEDSSWYSRWGWIIKLLAGAVACLLFVLMKSSN